MRDATPIEEASEAALFRYGASEGGKERARRLSPERRSEIARKAAESRWNKSVQVAINIGALVVGDQRIECAVLEDETRVLAQGTMLEALGRAKSMGRRGAPDEEKRAPFISANNLEPFIDAKLLDLLTPIEYRLPGSRFPSVGYRAESLPKVCDVYLEARKQGRLLPSQYAAAAAAEVLMRSLAQVGIIALVDEATGYQDVREKNALRRLLEEYVNESFRPWVQTFPGAFFEEIYRVYDWKTDPSKGRHPSYVGKFINTYVYDLLPDGVAEELRRVNPTIAPGRRARRHHQHLSVDTGNKHLDKQIATVLTLMSVSRDVDEFKELFARRFPDHSTRKERVLRVTVGRDEKVNTQLSFENLMQ